MTLERARILKAPARATPPEASGGGTTATSFGRSERGEDRGSLEAGRARRIAAEVIAAREEAARILASARDEAGAVAAAAAEQARNAEIARLAVELLAVREAEARRAQAERDRIVDIAVLLAERLIGEALRVEPARIGELAAAAIASAGGARRIRIDASPDDVDALRETLGAIGQAADVQADPTLDRGSLIVHTELGRIDGRLEPQLANLANAVREALR